MKSTKGINYKKIITLGVVISFLYSNIAWAAPILSNTSVSQPADTLAAQSGAGAVAQALRSDPAVGNLFKGEAVIERLGITDLTGLVQNMQKLTDAGVIAFIRPDKTDSSKTAIYLFSKEKGAFRKLTKKGEVVETDLDELLEAPGITETVGDTTSVWSRVPEARLSLVNSFLGDLSDGKWSISVESRPQPFGPIDSEEIDYASIIGGFKDDYEVTLDITKGRGNRFEPKGKNSANLAKLLNDAMNNIETIANLSGNLGKHWNELLKSPDNKSLPIRIRVNSSLPYNSVRYFNPVTNSVEIIFNEVFIKTLLDNYGKYPVASYLAGERIFHELGHSPVGSFYKELRQEYELIKWDAALYAGGRIQTEITAFIKEVKPQFPSGRYFKLIQALTENPNILKSFDILVKEVEELEAEQEKVYKQGKSNKIDNQSRQERNERIERAFQVGDPDNPSSIANQIKKEMEKAKIQGTYLNAFFEILTHRAIASGRESFLFMASDPLSVVAFDQLKNPRVPGWFVSPDKEGGRWARQYYAIHEGRRFSDGVGITEAENGRGMQQKWHKHDTTQEFTISICDNTQLRYGHELAEDSVITVTVVITDKDTKKETEVTEKVKYSAQALTDKHKKWEKKGTVKIKSITPVKLTDAKDQGKILEHTVVEDKNTIIVVDDERVVTFGQIICMPKNTFHTLRNTSATRPSTDFTVKDPVTQLIKTFSPPQEVLLTEIEIRQIKKKGIKDSSGRTAGEMYSTDYPASYNSRMLIDPATGEMLYRFDDKGNPVPVMYDPVGVTLKLGVVENGKETDRMPFVPFYDDMQVVRIFPWPREIPEDNKAKSFRHEWILDRDVHKIEAEFIVYDAQGNKIDSESKIVHGGDIVVLRKSLGEGITYSVRNISSNKNFKLVFFTLEPKRDVLSSFKSIMDMTQDKRADVRRAAQELLKDFIEKQDDATLAVLLQAALDENYDADRLSEIIRAFIALPDGKGLDRFQTLQQKFMIYSAAPATGKDEVMKAAFTRDAVKNTKGKYQDIVDKLILFHTRDPRVDKGICEKDGVQYHFRTNEQLEKLKREKGILRASVNRQWQGMADVDFEENGVEVKYVVGADKIIAGDQVVSFDASKKELVVNRSGTQITLEGVDIPVDKPGIFLQSDVVEKVNGDIVTVTRQIRGITSVFAGKKIVFMEGGYNWFRQLRDKYHDIVSEFISPYDDDKIKIRTSNTKWIQDNFTTIQDKFLAYRELARLILEVKKGEIDLVLEPQFQTMILTAVARADRSAINSVDLANAELIESPQFIDEVNKLLTEFGKTALSQEEYSMIRAMAYEVTRRLASREDNKTGVYIPMPFSTVEVRERFTDAGVDPQYDRFNRVLEGVVQIRYRNEYQFPQENRWGYSDSEIKEIIDNLTEDFTRAFFSELIKGVADALRGTKAASLSKKVDMTKKETVFYSVSVDINGNIVGDTANVRDEAKTDARFNEASFLDNLRRLMAYLKTSYGEGIFGPINEIVLVDNLGGIDSDIPEVQRGAATYLRGNQMLIDIDAVQNIMALMDVGVHESFEAILRLVEDNPGINEVTATYLALQSLLERTKANPADLDAYIVFLKQPNNGLDSSEYALLLEHLRDTRDTLDDKGLRALAIGYVLSTPRYEHLQNSLKGVLDSDIMEAERKIELAKGIYADIIKAKRVAIEELKGVLKPAIAKVKIADVKLKIKMVTSKWAFNTGFLDKLHQAGKFIRLDVDELAKPENKYMIDWLKGLKAQQQEVFVFYSRSGKGDAGKFIGENSLAGKDYAKLVGERKVEMKDIVTLVDLSGVDTGKSLADGKSLYLPYLYSISGVYLAAQIVVAEGDIGQIQDNLVKTTLVKTYEALFGEILSPEDLNKIFQGQWPKAYKITESINALRQAIAQIEIAA